MKNKNQTNC